MSESEEHNIIHFPTHSGDDAQASVSSSNEQSHSLPSLTATLGPSPEHGLIRIVCDAVDSVDWPNKGRWFGLNPSYRICSTYLMVLEVYCYARGIFESAEVENLARTNPWFQRLFTFNLPNRLLIRRFRRDHHPFIHASLLSIFDVAFQVRFGNPKADESPIDDCVARAIDEWFEPICGPRPGKEAEERIDQAIFWDGMAMAG